MKLIKGSELPPEARREVLATFVHRWTHENARQSYRGECPACVQRARRKGSKIVSGIPWHDFHVALTSDREWLADHSFWITNSGRLAKSRHRASTWVPPGVKP